MNKTLSAALIALVLAGCASKPVEPSWRSNAVSALDSFRDAYLKGDTSIAASDFARARSELASTGRADMVAHAELVRCAVYTASLVVGECSGFAALAGDATPAERAYAAYLAGQWRGLDVTLLPEQHQVIARGGPLAGVADPLSRLVAAGAMLQAGRTAPPDIVIAVDTASSQGWRRPLLMWLGVSEQRARAAGDTAEVERIQRRIALASSK
ncbi:lipoprotein [Massilia sp. TWR1-2-2]|uniref:lipoprotein n=1 Tax=Massilia sp. TWR1-2-2 TaxID=2804584 RepID=UPI003CF5F3DD